MDKREYKRINTQASDGNAKAFAKLYEMVYREMYYTAYYTLADDVDAVAVVTATAKDGFSVISKLRTEEAFRLFMMKNLCSRVKAMLKTYSREGRQVQYSADKLRPNDDGIDIKQEFNRLSDKERLVTCLYVTGKFTHADISRFTGMSVGAVKKYLRSALDGFALD